MGELTIGDGGAAVATLEQLKAPAHGYAEALPNYADKQNSLLKAIRRRRPFALSPSLPASARMGSSRAPASEAARERNRIARHS
eukprot:scaffold4298_cov99-Isochrysis_galbana.AAC.2